MKIELFYDKDCPFCNFYANYLKLKETHELILLNVRECKTQIDEFKTKGFDINKVHIAGGSYGAFIASMMLAMDAAGEQHFEKITLLSPPFNFRRSFERLDSYMDIFHKQYSMFSLSRNIISAYKGCKIRKLSKKTIHKFKGLVIYHGIQSSLIHTVFAYEKIVDRDLTPGSLFGWLRGRFHKWRKEARILPLVAQHMPNFEEVFSYPNISLKYWLDSAKLNNPKIDSLIITTEDDFINDYKR